MNLTLTITLGTLLLGGTASYGMLFHTGFEHREYTVGQSIDGHDGWIALNSPNAVVVVDGRSTAASGRRAASCWGGGPIDIVNVGPGFDLLDAAVDQPISFDPNARPTVVKVEADVRFDGPDTGNGPGDDLASANLYLRNGVGRSPFFYISSNGNAYAFANSENGNAGYQFETPIRQGQYNHLEIEADYTTHIATFSVNGHEVGSLPFGGAGEQFTGTLIEFAAWYDPSFDATLYTGYWDNLSVQARRATNGGCGQGGGHHGH